MLSYTFTLDSKLPMTSLVALRGSALLSCFRPTNSNVTPQKVCIFYNECGITGHSHKSWLEHLQIKERLLNANNRKRMKKVGTTKIEVDGSWEGRNENIRTSV